MPKLRLLVLTDHTTHSEENSIYPLLREMLKNPLCGRIDIASRGVDGNQMFFEKMVARSLVGCQVHSVFHYTPDGRFFKKNLEKLALRNYDGILMRVPYPVPAGFWDYAKDSFPNIRMINEPRGIEITGSKSFLLHFPELCPPMKRCRTLADIESFRAQFPIVLKPVHSYGGAGIFRIDGEKVYKAEGGHLSFENFCKEIEGKKFDFLGVKYLKNVDKGDKRIVVCNGEILGAALRKPAPGSWVCNISRGGSSHLTQPDSHEKHIVRVVHTALASHGVYFFGLDTLVGDDGKRVLSEINTASIGGLGKIEEYSGKGVARRAGDLLWERYNE